MYMLASILISGFLRLHVLGVNQYSATLNFKRPSTTFEVHFNKNLYKKKSTKQYALGRAAQMQIRLTKFAILLFLYIFTVLLFIKVYTFRLVCARFSRKIKN